MHRVPLAGAAIALATWLAPAPAQAQTRFDIAGYAGAIFTPIGALPTPLSAPQVDRAGTRLSVRGLYGHSRITQRRSAPRLDTFGVGAELSLGILSIDATGGYQAQSCPTELADCTGHLMGGAGATLRLIRGHIYDGDYDGDTEGVATVALDAHVGYASRREGGVGFILDLPPLAVRDTLAKLPGRDRFMAASVGLPISIVGRSGPFRLVTFVKPALVYGALRTRARGVFTTPEGIQLPAVGEFDANGARFQLGGGIAVIERSSGLGLQVGAQRTYVTGGATQFGVALTYGGSER